MKPLRICLDARLQHGVGGIEQFLIGMASGLSQLQDGDEEYVFLSHDGWDAWLQPYLGANCRVLHEPLRTFGLSRRILKTVPGARRLWDHLSPAVLGRRSYQVPRNSGLVESAGVDLMHFTLPLGFVTGLPSIYHPHDLQYRHLPEFFSPRQRMGCDILLKAMSESAVTVAVTSTWTKEDLIRSYGLPAAKIRVIPLAPSIEAYPATTPETMAATRRKYELPAKFVLYPARTFAHKNHLGLLEALAVLREKEGLVVPLVCSGTCDKFHATIMDRVRHLNLLDQVRFTGFVTPVELQCLYRTCQCVLIPTLFEAASFPLWEAFLAGTPAACSNVTSLPAQAGDAALVFDPHNPADIADAIRKLWTDPELCRTLVERGRVNVSRFTWKRTTSLFRAHYRRIAGRELSAAERDLIDEEPWL